MEGNINVMIDNELELIRKAQQGNKSALNTLITENYSLLKGYIIKITGDPDMAQDITQETLMKAVLNIKKYRPEAKFSTWLIKIATNTYIDMIRKDKKHTSIEDINMTSKIQTEETALLNLEYEDVLKILKSMSYEKRTVFILKHYYNYKYEEIADILNCPVGTVRSRLHNCIKSIILELERRDKINEKR